MTACCCCAGPSRSFSGAASKTLKNRLPPGETSSILAILPHLIGQPRVLRLAVKATCERVGANSPVAVIGCTPDCTELVVVQDRVTLHAQLVRAEDMTHAVELQELLDDRCAERISRASAQTCQLSIITGRGKRVELNAPGTNGEILLFRIWIAPDQICHGTFMRYFPEPIDNLDLVDMMDRGTEAAVHAKDGIVNDDREGEKVKHVGKILPDRGGTVFARTFEVEPVCLRGPGSQLLHLSW